MHQLGFGSKGSREPDRGPTWAERELRQKPVDGEAGYGLNFRKLRRDGGGYRSRHPSERTVPTSAMTSDRRERKRKKRHETQSEQGRGHKEKLQEQGLGSEPSVPTDELSHGVSPKEPSFIVRNGVGTLRIPARRRVCLSGMAKMRVEEGNVWVMGRQVTPESGEVMLETDWANSPPLLLECMGGFDEKQRDAVMLLKSCGKEVESSSLECVTTDDQLKQLGYCVWVGSPLERSIVSDAWLLGLDDLLKDALGQRNGGEALRIAVCGAKGMGKSTLGRLVVNTLLNCFPMVAFLETDVGQPEFTPPGLVSITLIKHIVVGPPHIHQKHPARAHFIGDTSPKSDTALYTKSVEALVSWFGDYCMRRGISIPLVCNTNGWIRGVGLEVLKQILCVLDPTHIFQMTSSTASKNLPEGSFWLGPSTRQQVHCRHVFVPSVDTSALSELGGPKCLGASDCRDLVWFEFARQCAPRLEKWEIQLDNVEESFKLMVDFLCKEAPFILPARAVAISMAHDEIPEEMYAFVLNSSVVGLLEKNDGNRIPNCVGLGLVRGVDQEQGLLYILTPVPDNNLCNVGTLALGQLEFPTVLLESENYPTPYISHWSIEKGGSGSGNMRSHSNKLGLPSA